MLWYGTVRYAMLRFGMLCYAKSCRAMLNSHSARLRTFDPTRHGRIRRGRTERLRVSETGAFSEDEQPFDKLRACSQILRGAFDRKPISRLYRGPHPT